MSNYDIFAKFYDKTMWDRTNDINFLLEIFSKFSIKWNSILELACWTWQLLKHFEKLYNVNWVDLSKWMLDIAKSNIKNWKFYLQNISNFKINEKFDIILCLFDSLNHLINFEDWKNVFINSYNHLTENWFFIFDINTLFKLKKFSKFRDFVKIVDKNMFITKITHNWNNVFNWNIKIFENKQNNKYELYEENIHEISFQISKIKKWLIKFNKISIIDKSFNYPKKNCDRVYFICQK